MVDITDPAQVVWAAVREDRSQLPGSVGKLGVMIGLFDGLRRAFPDPAVRALVLKERVVVAEDWAVGDPHTTPHFDPETGRNRFSTIAVGERFSLAEWVDHMISASANSAGSTVWKEAMLLRHFGSEYPPTVEQEHAFFKNTPKSQLTELSLAVINEPLAAAGHRSRRFSPGHDVHQGGPGQGARNAAPTPRRWSLPGSCSASNRGGWSTPGRASR